MGKVQKVSVGSMFAYQVEGSNPHTGSPTIVIAEDMIVALRLAQEEYGEEPEGITMIAANVIVEKLQEDS